MNLIDYRRGVAAFLRAVAVAFLVAVFAASLLQPASATTINFDNFADGALVTTPISGVSFTLSNNTKPSIFAIQASGGTTSSPPNTLLNASRFNSANTPAPLTMTFGTPVDDLKFTYTYDNGDITFTVFQGGTTTSITKPLSGFPTTLKTADFSAFGGVTALTLSSAYPDDYVAIDDISFSPIPEPTTATFLLLGMLGCGSRWRRRS